MPAATPVLPGGGVRWRSVIAFASPYDGTLSFAGRETVSFPDIALPPGEARLLRVEVDPGP